MRRPVPKNILSKDNTSGLTTDTGPSYTEEYRRPGGLGGALVIRGLTGTAPSITGKVQHSPSPMSVADASAVWLDLLTFTAQTATGAQFQQVSTPYFPRLRATVTRGGTAVTDLDYDMMII
jgi:hypothetical protein